MIFFMENIVGIEGNDDKELEKNWSKWRIIEKN